MLTALVGLAKFPYVVLALLLLLPIRRFDRALLHRAGLVVGVMLPGLLWVGYVMAKVTVPWPPIPAYTAGPLWPGPPGTVFHSPVPAGQIQVILSDPVRVITITWNTISTDPWIYRSAIGILGFLTLQLPGHLYQIWAASLLSACRVSMINNGRSWTAQISARDSIVVAAIIGIGVIAIYMSQYLTWTQVGATTAFGPTGRYLLPLAPTVVLALPKFSGPGLTRICGILIGLTCLAACAGIFAVPRVIAQCYQG